MMFGFKTKKDKKIESQEEKIKKLEEMIYESRFKQPQIYQPNAKVATATAAQMLEPGMPIDLAKSRITAMLVEELKDRIYFDVEQYDGTLNVVLRGYLNYVIDWETRER